jgi:DNA-binding response OmpR family regulator
VRILVVEDERHMATALVRGLTAEGYAVDLAPSGDSALRCAREHDYDAIVLDLMLPGLDGYQVCTALREEQNWVPILVLTAKDGEADEARALNTGADDFLSKPFSFVVLLARLQALLRRGARERPAVLGVGDLSLDPGTGSCRRGEVDIVLTAREFAVLEYLLRHAGQVVPKTEILEHVWGGDFEGDDNVVEVYVAYLRRKIDRPFGRQALQTLRGFGYRLDDDGG